MFERPCFKPHFQVEILKPDKVFLFDASGRKIALEGTPYVLLAPYLKKGRPLDEMIGRLQTKLHLEEIYFFLLRLQEKGLIEEFQQETPKPLASLCHLLKVPLKEAKERLQNTRISLETVGRVSASILKRQLQKSFMQIGPEATLKVVVADHYRHQELHAINQQCLEKKIPWLLTKVKGGEIWIGPLFLPGKTGCYACLKKRLELNELEEKCVETQSKRPMDTPDTLFPSAEVAAKLAMSEILKWVIQGENEQIEGKVLSFNFFTSRFTSHSLTKRPQCSACGHPEMPFPRPLHFQSQTDRLFEDGGRRAFSPEKTYQQYQHLISPITGIIHSVEPCGQNSCVHIYLGGKSLSGIFRNRPYMKEPCVTSGGKGKTEMQAKVSCLCEAIERYSVHFQGNESRTSSTYWDLKADAIHPDELQLFSTHQYEIRKHWNKDAHNMHYIPVPFDEKKSIEWSPLWSLTEKRFKWVPTAFCYFLYPQLESECFCNGDSNGCAAGNTLEEAILQGFFELIERDSMALWWYSRCQRPGVDFSSFQDPYIEQLQTHYASLQRELWALDLTADFEIPTFAAISRKIDSKSENILLGLGSHFDPNIALCRALTELNQSLALEKYPQKNHPVLEEWLKNATIQEHSYLLPSPHLKNKKWSDYKRLDSEDDKQDVLTCQKLVEDKGMEMLVLDQTRPDIKLPVVRVVVPRLRHFWNRYAPGRLYDIPVELGWVEKKLKEEELNPIPFFL